MAATPRAVDLSNAGERAGFRPRRKPEGDYRAKVVKADDHQPNDKTKPMGWVLTIQVEGDNRSTYPFYLSPEEKQAWKIGQVCRAAGLKVPNSRVRFDPNKLVNKAIGLYLEDDEYEGRPKSVIAETFPVSEVGANADEDAPDGDEIIDDDEIVDDEPEPEPAPRRRRKPAPEPEPEDDEELDDEEEEPAPPPRKRTAAKKTAAPARKRAPAPPVEEDDDLDLDDLDDIEQ